MRPLGRRWMLSVAVVGYLLSAWAWALLGPLAPMLHDTLCLTAVEQALVVAVPVVVGALGRVPIGALTDRFGGRAMFLLVISATMVALLELAVVGYRSVAGLMIGAVLLGVAGTTFAVGVPFVSAWFPGGHRGLALGMLGTGLCGTAIGGLTAIRLVQTYGIAAPFLVTAIGLGAFALLAVVAVHDAPRRSPPATRIRVRFAAALRLQITRQAVTWYACSFALFVTFSSYLPVYLATTYDVSPTQAGDAMAAFVLVAVLMRPVGGWLSDRLAPPRPLTGALAVLTAATAVQACTPPLPVVLAVTLPVLAVGLGIANTAVLAQIGAVAPAPMVGLVTGVVTAAAGLAGFLSPLLMAFSVDRHGGYGPALGVLAAGAALAAATAISQTGRPALQAGFRR